MTLPLMASESTGREPPSLEGFHALSNQSNTTANELAMPASASDAPVTPSARTSRGSRCSTNVKPSAARFA